MFEDLKKTLARNTDRTLTKRNCAEWKIEAIVAEVEANQTILLDGHSVTNKSKSVKSHCVTAAVKAASSEGHNISEIKKKLNMKVDCKKDISVQ